jgi:hypothetical protein
MKRENGDVPSLPCCSPRLEERGLHTAIETLLGHCDSNFMPIALFPGRFTRMREIGYATRTDAQELRARTHKIGSCPLLPESDRRRAATQRVAMGQEETTEARTARWRRNRTNWGVAEQGIRKAEFVRGSEIGASVKMIVHGA